jgi:radical SAM superfamily enzyme YgiQ (UPF0313 family)
LRVLLIQPPSSWAFADKVFMHEPLALEYLGAGAKLDGHTVRIHDSRLNPDIDSVQLEFKPQVIGLTGYTSQVPIIRQYADRVKNLDPSVTVIIGGHHATVCPQDFNRPSIDMLVIGEGVLALREILGYLSGNNKVDGLERIQGLAIPGAPMRYTTPRPYTPLDELPLPDRILTRGYREHYFSEWLKPLASIRTSLGCTSKCSFCALWKITGGKYLRRRPENVVEELASIEENKVFFCDDESMCDLRRMDRLADLIQEAGIRKKYFLYARGDTIVRNPVLFAKWRDIGLHLVFCGMESFSQDRLRRLDKGLSIEQQEKAVNVLNDLGIIMYASFMVDPDFTREDFRALRSYIRRLKIKYASFSILTPLPGTRLSEERREEILSYQPELYDFLHSVLPTRLPLKEFYAEFSSMYRDAIPLRRSLPILARYGLRRIPAQLKLIKPVLDHVRSNYLDHSSKEQGSKE